MAPGIAGDEPPALDGVTQLTRLALDSVNLIPHLGPLKQLRQLDFVSQPAAALTFELIECLSDMASLQEVEFAGKLQPDLRSRLHLQVCSLSRWHAVSATGVL